jgi:signal transduction histidine kinase/ActR/RegA family two-component response regulator
MTISPDPHGHLVLVAAPFGRDGDLICQELIKAKLLAACEANVQKLCDRLDPKVSAVIVAEEALTPKALACFLDVLRKQEPWSDLPVLVLTVDGKTTPASAGVIQSLSVCCNITLLERPVRIQTIVAAVQAALRARQKQLEVRDLLNESERNVRQRDEFLAMLGHELRNPVGTIRNAIEVLENVGSHENRMEVEQRAIIRRQARHVGHLIDDLLDVSRVTTGKISLYRLPVDLREMIVRCVQAAESAIEAERHQVSLDIDEQSLVVDGDPVRIEQIITNLLTNAIKYTPTRGRIEIAARRKGDMAVVSVRDNGLGISPELLPHIFDLFTQGHRTIDRAHGGLGIGLTVVRSLVEMHGGKISVESEGSGPHRGSLFTVELPLSHAELRGTDVPVRTKGARRRVLVVEDNADARKALRVLLQLCGHDVEVAEDGLSGVEKAVRLRPEVALVDIGLPKLDGYGVAREVRNSLGNQICLVALTGYGQPDDQRRATDAGFDLHLTKPVDPERLFETIGQAGAGKNSE